jgi:hypothetical protein
MKSRRRVNYASERADRGESLTRFIGRPSELPPQDPLDLFEDRWRDKHIDSPAPPKDKDIVTNAAEIQSGDENVRIRNDP